MRVLKFIVTGKTLEQDPSCDFSGLFPGREDRIKAVFSFSKEWDRAIKVAAFVSVMGTEYTPQVLDDENSCFIPVEALARPVFKMQVLGKRSKTKLETNTLNVYQKGGKT